MRYFRECNRRSVSNTPPPKISPDRIRGLIEESLDPANFYEKTPGQLVWEHHAREEISWEIFQGRLLDASQTRMTRQFESWDVYWNEDETRSSEPLVSLKLSVADREFHVTRAIYSYAWEGYHAGDNVYLSREVAKWVRELVGTIQLDDFADENALRDEIICQVFQAIVGTSRLPLTSIESPVPSFSLGEIAYFHRPDLTSASRPHMPICSWAELIEQNLGEHLNASERAKLLETVLRSIEPGQIEGAALTFSARWRRLGWSRKALLRSLRTLFNEIALSPYTAVVKNILAFVDALSNMGQLKPEDVIDFLSYLLRQTARHLTAYDLFTFHHSGANYPDAPMLAEVLHAYLEQVELRPDFFVDSELEASTSAARKRIRRRALREALLQWHLYQGLRVPDVPTSPGENSRILPAPFVRVPEEQILVPAKRTRRLFADAELALDRPATGVVLRQCFADLAHPEELQELGTAVYLDRPLGILKPAAAPDQTPLLSYELFSKSLVVDRLRFLGGIPALGQIRSYIPAPESIATDLSTSGLPLRPDLSEQRPGVVVLEDAARIADDFVLIRTTGQSARDFLDLFDFTPLAHRFDLEYLESKEALLIVRANVLEDREPNILMIFDGKLRRRLELEVDSSSGFRSRAGVEFPRAGLRAQRVWTRSGTNGELGELDLRHEKVNVPVRD
jgi:hypothetical protein